MRDIKFMVQVTILAVLVAGGFMFFATILSEKEPKSETDSASLSSVVLDEKIEAWVRANPQVLVSVLQAEARKVEKGIKEDRAEKVKMGTVLITEADDYIRMGASDPSIIIYEFYDPNCPHCRSFDKIRADIMKENPSYASYIVPFAALGPDSSDVAAILFAAHEMGLGQELLAILSAQTSRLTGQTTFALMSQNKDIFADQAAEIMKRANTAEITEKVQKTIGLARMMGVQGTPFVAIEAAGSGELSFFEGNIGRARFLETVEGIVKE